jgi:hypothetical protein
MTDSNPYTSPTTEPESDASPKSSRPFRARVYVIPALIGAVIGSVVLAPFCRGPGDPGGHSIGAGLGGFVGLLIGIVIHTIMITLRRNQ